MKTFNDFEQCFNWLDKATGSAYKAVIPVVTEQIYKDSNEFTFCDTGEMYQSGEMYQDLKNGIVVERTPYVRRRYYEGGKPGAKSPKQAQAKWFDKTFRKYKKDYIKQAEAIIKKSIRS